MAGLCILVGIVLCGCSGVEYGVRSPPTVIAGAPATAAPVASAPTAAAPTTAAPTPTVATAGACDTISAGADGTTPATPAAATHRDDSADRDSVEYDADTNTIVLRRGAPDTLAALSSTLGRASVLRELAPGEWLLSANLRVEQDAALRIAAPEVRWLKLRSDGDGFVSIKALAGQLTFEGACVTSWDMQRASFDENDADGRSFVLARDGARMDIRSSELSYLGYEADESYGVAWRLAGTSGEIIDSHFGYNFYGLYSYEASGLLIRGNEVHHSVRYGIDPHTRSNRLIIEGNIAHHNGKQGIILAEKCNDSVIRNNVVHDNALHGIVVYQRSNNNIVEGNTSYSNGLQGININDSNDNTVRDNVVYDNAEAGIGVGQDAKGNLIAGNTVRDNREDGITFYSDARANVLRDNSVSGNARYGIYVKSENNTIGDGNQIFNNAVGIYLSTGDPQRISRETNHIYDNRQGDIRTADE